MNIEQEWFEAWLFAQPGDRVIESGSPQNCFLCSFLKETAQCKNPGFSWEEWTENYNFGFYQHDAPMNKIPNWAKKLINAWDLLEIIASSSLGLKVPITCAQMQTRYIKLFGDPRNIVPAEKVQEPALV